MSENTEKHPDQKKDQKKAKITPSNIRGFIQGNFRKLVEDLPGIIPDYIYEQIQWRLTIMDENCLRDKQCPCTCSVPAKQYEDRPCENSCYPPMMNKDQWEEFKALLHFTEESIEKGLYERSDLLWGDF